jgi:hypothetical protein
MNLFSQNKPKADPEKVQDIKNWVYRILEVDSDTSISINQLACKEAGCPPIETVIVVMSTPIRQYKIHKAVNDIDEIDICGLS